MDTQYKIIGGDGAEYGPAPLDELKSWILDGRVASMTKVWRSDLSAWSPADRYSELRGALATLHAVANPDLPAAGFWSRLAAFIIDCIVLTVLSVAIWTPLAGWQHWQMSNPPQTLADALDPRYQDQLWTNGMMLVFFTVFLFYDVLLNGRFGATIGKMAIGARITMLDGSPIGYGRALFRWLAARVSDLFFGYILIAMRRDKRGLHDLLAGTKVVFKR